MKEREEDKFVGSFARWLAGLSPKRGRGYYFERYLGSREMVELLEKYRGLRVCPFCNAVFRRVSGFITHIIARHREEVVEMIADRLR
jgi:hypothetical protein